MDHTIQSNKALTKKRTTMATHLLTYLSLAACLFALCTTAQSSPHAVLNENQEDAASTRQLQQAGNSEPSTNLTPQQPNSTAASSPSNTTASPQPASSTQTNNNVLPDGERNGTHNAYSMLVPYGSSEEMTNERMELFYRSRRQCVKTSMSSGDATKTSFGTSGFEQTNPL
jgi:hypothetical protein